MTKSQPRKTMSKKKEKPKKVPLKTITLPDTILNQDDALALYERLRKLPGIDNPNYNFGEISEDIYVDVIDLDNLESPKKILFVKKDTEFLSSVLHKIGLLLMPWWECVHISGHPGRFYKAPNNQNVIMYPRYNIKDVIDEHSDIYRSFKNGFVLITKESLMQLVDRCLYL